MLSFVINFVCRLRFDQSKPIDILPRLQLSAHAGYFFSASAISKLESGVELLF